MGGRKRNVQKIVSKGIDMLNDDGFIYGVSVEYANQNENLIAKCKFDVNAFLIAKYIMDNVNNPPFPIVRIIDLDKKECLGSYQKEIKQLDKTSTIC